MKLCLVSLGCTKNLVDAEVMLGRLRKYEIIDDVASADVIIINTCGFIASAKQESIGVILDAVSKKKRGAILVVSGCLSARYSSELKEEILEIDIITGVGDYNKIDLMIDSLRSSDSTEVFLADENDYRVISGSRLHSYIKISEGCNQSCSFCSIPSFKGKLHSRNIDSILKEMESLAGRGYMDFSLVAQDSSSFMRDLGARDGLLDLVNAIDESGIPRSLRVLYLYPSTTTLELIEKIGKSKVVQSYFDMPIQHISASMLSKMKRGVSVEKHIEICKAMREVNNSFLRTSFIIGHPQESEADFERLCEFVEGFLFDRVNIFAFSDEEGTLAHTMDSKIDDKTINERINILDSILQKQQKALSKSMLDKEIDIILEGRSEVSEHFYSARDVRWAPQIDGEILINDSDIDDIVDGYYTCKITQVEDDYVFGKILSRK